jgi:hypothetical protein
MESMFVMHSSRKKLIDDELMRCELELESMLGAISNTLGCSCDLGGGEADSNAEVIFQIGDDTWKIESHGYVRLSIFKNKTIMYSLWPSITTEPADIIKSAAEIPDIHYILHAQSSGALNPSFNGFFLRFECIVDAGKEYCCGYKTKENKTYKISFELTWKLITIDNSDGCAWENFEDQKRLAFGWGHSGSSKVEMSAVTDLRGDDIYRLILAWGDADPTLFILCPTFYIQSKEMKPVIKYITPAGNQRDINWSEYYQIIENLVKFGVPKWPEINWVLLKIVANQASLTVDHRISNINNISHRFIFDFELPIA